MKIYISLLFATIRSALRAREDVALENLALRHQLAIMTRSARRPRLGPADRLLWCWLYNEARPHRALALEPPAGVVQLALGSGGRVIARPVLGGLLYEYEKKAA